MFSARLILTLLILVVTLPFINQAFHIDDRIYLEIASNILEKPLYPYDFPAIFEGYQAADAASHSHLPLISYYLAGLKLVSGADREWFFHLGFLVFPIMAGLSMHDVARRYVASPLVAAILLVVFERRDN